MTNRCASTDCLFAFDLAGSYWDIDANPSNISMTLSKIKAAVIWALLFAGIFPLGFAQEDLPTVKLMTQDKQTVLHEDIQSRLRRQLIALLQSSNFHSGPGDKNHIFTSAAVQQDYRNSVAAGQYLLLIFPAAQKIGTVGGEITVTEIVFGLHRPGGRNSLFTIDDSGRVVSHAKYSGALCLEVDKTVAAQSP